MRVKYPRTFHLPWSPGVSSDDKVLKSVAPLLAREVVVSEKADGENTTLYQTGFHARSIDSRHHPSRDWLARFHSTFAHDIPEGWRICGENLYARHSIAYDDLPSYFLGFSVWDASNTCLSWDDTLEVFELLGVTPVRVLARGNLTEADLRALSASLDLEKQEGFVVRPVAAFAYAEFGQRVGKFVRAGHVQTDKHWSHQAIVPNGLASH